MLSTKQLKPSSDRLRNKVKGKNMDFFGSKLIGSTEFMAKAKAVVRIVISSIVATVLVQIPLASLASAQTSSQYYRPSIDNDWPDSRYEINSDATVKDLWTGLMWQRCIALSSLNDRGTPDDFTDDLCQHNDNINGSDIYWQEAINEGTKSTKAGYGDWRVPNVKELHTLLAYDRASPAINEMVFPNTAGSASTRKHWTSSPSHVSYDEDRNIAWIIYFDNQGIFPGKRQAVVRLVRDVN